MQTRQTILWLVAAGRITGAEAERLLMATNEGRETFWIVMGCMMLCLAQIPWHMPVMGLEQAVHRVWSAEWGLLYRALELVKEMGGRL